MWLTTQSFVARYNGVSIENFNLEGNTGEVIPVSITVLSNRPTTVCCKCLMPVDAYMNIIRCKTILML